MPLRDSIINNQFIRNVFTLFSGSALAQLIGFAFLPILTRLFTPEEFGVFSIFLTTASILSIIITGGYEKSFVIAKSEDEAKHLLLFSIILSTGLSVISLLVLFLIENWGTYLFQSSQSRLILWSVPVYSFLFGIFRIFQNWSIRGRNYNLVSGSNIIRSGSLSMLQTGFGLVNSGSFGLVAGSCISQLLPLLYLFIKNKNKLENVTKESLRKASVTGRDFKSFIFFKMPSDLVNEASIQLPVYVLISVFSKAIAGIYSLPQKVLSQPSKFIGQAVGEIYYRQVSEMETQGKDISEITYKTYKTLLLCGIVPFMIILLWGQSIFSFVFSSVWKESGMIAEYLSPWLFFVFAGSPVTYIFLLKKKLKLSLILNLCLFFLRFIALLTGGLILKNLNMTVLLFAGVSFIYWVFISFYSLYLSGVKIYKSVIFTLFVIVSVGIPLGLIKHFLL
jgi:lipopolysaccharide exporter